MRTPRLACLISLPAALALGCDSDDPAADAGADTGAADVSDAAPDVDPDTTPDVPEVEVRTTFRWEPLDLEGGVPVWGAIAVNGWLVGGVTADQKVVTSIAAASLDGTTLSVNEVGATDVARYCQCGFYDATRGELVIIGGRNRTFNDATSAVLIDTATWEPTSLGDNPADDFPVGCQAFFSPASDKGYVFGGLSSTRREFSDVTYRYDPVTYTFDELDVVGPAGRYDAAVHVLADGDALMISGMGLGAGAVFYDDVWRFDVDSETWSEVAVTGDRPPGRRYAWSALSPDETLIVFGYGSDSPMGQSVLDDLWTFDLTTGVWAPLEPEGERPSARGFGPNWQLPDSAAADWPDLVGLLGFGSTATMQVTSDVFALVPPTRHAGRWH